MKVEHAFRLDALPVNPRPFAAGLSELLSAGEPISGDKCKAVLWMLNSMAFGQLATIDMSEEWARLDATLPKE